MFHCLSDLFVLVSHRQSRTPETAKMNIFVTTVNDYQPLTVVTMNFVLDVTDVLDLCNIV